MQQLFLLLALLFSLVSCDDGGEKTNNTNQTNNNPSGNYSVHFVTPPDGELTLLTGERTPLSIRLLDSRGVPLAGEVVEFMIHGPAGGSSLSEATDTTDDAGEAGIFVSGGTTAAHFKITVSHERAAPISFDVTVSETGLATFNLEFDYQGVQEERFSSMDVGLLFGTTCDSTTLLTQELTRPRSLHSLSEVLTYDNLPVDVPFIFTARLLTEDGTLMGYGCHVPEEEQLTPGSHVSLQLALTDYTITLEATALLTGETSASALSPAVSATVASWSELGRCTYGVSMAILDCLVSYLEQGDPATCSRGAPTELSEAIVELRGIADGSGCRGSLNAFGGASLEANLQNASPDLGPIQSALMAMRQFLLGYPYEDLTVHFSLLQVEASLALTADAVQFSRISDQIYPLIPPWDSTPATQLPYTGLTSWLEIAPTPLTLGLLPLALQILWERHLKPHAVALEGGLFVARLQEVIQESSGIPWQQRLQELISTDLTHHDLERGFRLLAGRLSLPNVVPPGGDLLLEGALLFSDENQDQVADFVAPFWTLQVDPQGEQGGVDN